MNVMITGAAGFIGGFLAKHCLDADCAVLGLDIKDPSGAWADAAFERCDVRDATHFSKLISAFRPDRIFHLAAQSYPTVSMLEPRETIETNMSGTVNLFESVRGAAVMPTIVVACSSAEYGLVASEDLPVRENHPLRPLHPYGVSKVGQDLLAAQYFANYSIPAIRIRIFNTTGPSKIGDVCSDFARRAVEISLGMHPPYLRVGNMNKRRALVDVRDMVRGLWLAAERCEAGDVYNVGGTQIYSIEEVIQTIRDQMDVAFSIQQDPDLVRACDEPVIAGDITKFGGRSGWAPEIPLDRTLRDMIEWWKKQLSAEADSEPLASTGPPSKDQQSFRRG